MIKRQFTCLTNLALFLAITVTLLVSLPTGSSAIEVEPKLRAQIDADETTGYTIHFGEKANLTQAPKTGWKEQRDFVTKMLHETANRSQARVRSYLFNRKVPFRSMWTDNVIIVDRSDKDTFEGLAFFPEIEAIRAKPETGAQVPSSYNPENKEGIPTNTGR